MNKYLEKENGITLIALVVVTIVTIILSGITIAMLSGSNGLISKSLESKKENVIADDIEKIKASYSSVKVSLLKLADGKNRQVTTFALKKQLISDVLHKDLSDGDILSNTEIIAVDGSEPGTISVTMPSQKTYIVDSNGGVTMYNED